MSLTIFFATISGIAVLWFIVSSIIIVNDLLKRGQKINFIFIKAMIPVYAHRYKKITFNETGRVGQLYYHWVISINTALVFAVASIISIIV
jgi:hypothetical protein